jgi:euchromatic histone-lysine N-methyltransferase
MCTADAFFSFLFFLFEQRRLGDVSVPAINNFDGDDQKSESVPEFCIDAGSTGNIARFINHSCEPNLFVQCVLSSHHDVKLARVMLFAADNIPPMQVIHYFSCSVFYVFPSS